MNDRELLERAARAVGPDIVWTDCDGKFYTGDPERLWQPLEDDADAFRLMVDLHFNLEHEKDGDFQFLDVRTHNGTHLARERISDFRTQTRRAITRAAAALSDNA